MSIAQVLRSFFNPAERPPTDRELADLGLSRVDYNQLVSGAPGTRERMEFIAAQFGVTPEMIDMHRPEALDIAELCAQCSEAGACQNALEGKRAFDPYRCPNANRYRALASVG